MIIATVSKHPTFPFFPHRFNSIFALYIYIYSSSIFFLIIYIFISILKVIGLFSFSTFKTYNESFFFLKYYYLKKAKKNKNKILEERED